MANNFGISGRAGSGKDTFGGILLEVLKEKGLSYNQYAFARPLKDFTKAVFLFNDYDVYDQDGKEQMQYMRYNERDFKRRFKTYFHLLLLQLSKNNDQLLTYEGGSKDQVLEQYYHEFKEVLSAQTCRKSGFRSFADWFNPKQAVICFHTSPRVILQLLGTEFFRERIRNDFWTAIAPKAGNVITDMRFPNEIDFVKECDGITVGIERPSQTSISSSGHSSENVGPVLARCDYIVVNDKDLNHLREQAEHVVQLLKV